jgi:CRISPR-associated protein Cas1
MALLLGQGVGVAFLSLGGRLWGNLTPVQSRNVFLRLAQHERYRDAAYCLAWGKALIRAKISAQVNRLREYRRNHPETDLSAALATLARSITTVEEADQVESLRGVEGNASEAYFRAFPLLLRGELAFSGRNRHPPRDPVNALLSLTYVLAMNELGALAEGQGLDPYIGFLHGLRYGRQSLACDLVEPFRPALCDRFVLAVINRRQVNAESFQPPGAHGVRLKEEALKSYLDAWEDMLDGKGRPDDTGWRGLFRATVTSAVRGVFRGHVPEFASIDGRGEPVAS